jgi:transposase
VRETGKPIAPVARELGINEGTLGNWCAIGRRARDRDNGSLSEGERGELVRLRLENAGLAMEPDVPQAAGARPVTHNRVTWSSTSTVRMHARAAGRAANPLVPPIVPMSVLRGYASERVARERGVLVHVA